MHMCGNQGVCGNSVPSNQFCCEPKTALKTKVVIYINVKFPTEL